MTIVKHGPDRAKVVDKRWMQWTGYTLGGQGVDYSFGDGSEQFVASIEEMTTYFDDIDQGIALPERENWQPGIGTKADFVAWVKMVLSRLKALSV